MEVRNVRWVGIYTHHYREMVSLLRDKRRDLVKRDQQREMERALKARR